MAVGACWWSGCLGARQAARRGGERAAPRRARASRQTLASAGRQRGREGARSHAHAHTHTLTRQGFWREPTCVGGFASAAAGLQRGGRGFSAVMAWRMRSGKGWRPALVRRAERARGCRGGGGGAGGRRALVRQVRPAGPRAAAHLDAGEHGGCCFALMRACGSWGGGLDRAGSRWLKEMSWRASDERAEGARVFARGRLRAQSRLCDGCTDYHGCGVDG